MKPVLSGVLAALIAATAIPARAQAKLNVITTTEDLAAIGREVGGDRVSIEAIARGYQDPHFVEAKPSFILKLQRADLLVVVGRELEIGWLPPLIQQSRNARIQPGASGYLDASLQARILEMPQGQVTRAMVVVAPWCVMVRACRSFGVRGALQAAHSGLPASSVHCCSSAAASA